jgi:hypothetical protein
MSRINRGLVDWPRMETSRPVEQEIIEGTETFARGQQGGSQFPDTVPRVIQPRTRRASRNCASGSPRVTGLTLRWSGSVSPSNGSHARACMRTSQSRWEQRPKRCCGSYWRNADSQHLTVCAEVVQPPFTCRDNLSALTAAAQSGATDSSGDGIFQEVCRLSADSELTLLYYDPSAKQSTSADGLGGTGKELLFLIDRPDHPIPFP